MFSYYSVKIELIYIFLSWNMNNFLLINDICSNWVLAVRALYEIHIVNLGRELRTIIFSCFYSIFKGCL